MTLDPDRGAEPPRERPGRRALQSALETATHVAGEGRRRVLGSVQRLERRRSRSPSVDLVFRSMERDRDIHAGTFAAALAFRFFLFLLPVTLLTIVLLGVFISSDPSESQDLVDRFGLRGALADALVDATNQGRSSQWWALAVGLGGTVWAARGCVRAIRLAYFLAWDQRPRPLTQTHRAVGGFLAAYGLLLGTPLLAGWARAVLGVFGDIAGGIGVFALYVALWTVVLRMLPHAVEHWRYLFPGALLLAVGSDAIQLVTAYFFAPRLERAASVYGAVAVAAVMLTWLFLIARILISAAVVNAVLEERRQRLRRRSARPAPGESASGPAGPIAPG